MIAVVILNIIIVEEYDEKGNKIKLNPSSCSFCRQNIEYNKL